MVFIDVHRSVHFDLACIEIKWAASRFVWRSVTMENVAE